MYFMGNILSTQTVELHAHEQLSFVTFKHITSFSARLMSLLICQLSLMSSHQTRADSWNTSPTLPKDK